jgi:cytochrome c peroxidase
LALLLSACGGGDPGASSSSPTATAADATVASDTAQPSEADPPALRADGTSAGTGPDVRALAATVDAPAAVEVGDKLFHDPRLSASGRIACGTCHTEEFGHADVPGTTLPKGGPGVNLLGMRSSPTVRYLNLTPPFRLSLLGTPSGGYLWDGRADSRFEQAFFGSPFFNPVEMALPGDQNNPKAVTDLVRSAPYWNDLKALYVNNPSKIATDAGLFREVATLLETYQRGDPDYNPFDSKFDQVQAGTATFTAEEKRGWAIFSDPLRGNCTACHSASLNARSLFTNFGYAALGVPRNHLGPKNADPSFYDLGLCAREKVGATLAEVLVKGVPRYCGLFKTPTLRNVERTAPYFHNGAVATLEEAVRFYFTRDSQPAKWYRKKDGTVDQRYNDLPWYYQGNLARGLPFSGLYKPTDQDIADLLAFLKTLNDADQTTPLR